MFLTGESVIIIGFCGLDELVSFLFHMYEWNFSCTLPQIEWGLCFAGYFYNEIYIIGSFSAFILIVFLFYGSLNLGIQFSWVLTLISGDGRKSALPLHLACILVEINWDSHTAKE